MLGDDEFDRMDKAGGDWKVDWKVTAAAWLVPILFASLLGAADALASRHHGPPAYECQLTGAMIPRHNSSIAGPDEIAASDWLERVRAEAYSGM
jgi:hypothetical protein